MRQRAIALLTAVFLSAAAHVSAQTQKEVDLWLTTSDRTSLLGKQPEGLPLHPASAQPASITISDAPPLQTIDGFGFALTGGSAQLLMRMTPSARTALLRELFGPDKASIGVSYLRLSIGSSDMNDHVFTYDDLPAGEKDPQLARFSLGSDLEDVIPVMREILAINPKITVMATPWSAPSWMKTNDKPKGGSLRLDSYGVYAQYLVKYLQAMASHGIHIAAITPQNEPLNPKNTPSLVMGANEEAVFIADALGPALRDAALGTEIIVYDHNCDKPEYPLTILSDTAASPYVAGSGFHLYGGTVAAMTQVHDAFPAKNIYFTEQMVIQNGSDLPFRIAEPVSRVVIGATRNWAGNVLLWNLAADSSNGPHTAEGGCPICQGAVTIDGDKVTRNIAFYTVAQVSKFVPPGSKRLDSTGADESSLPEVAFSTPSGGYVLLVANTAKTAATFNVRLHDKEFEGHLDAGAVGTFVWR